MVVFTLLLSYSALQVCLLVKADRSFGDKDLRDFHFKNNFTVSGRKGKNEPNHLETTTKKDYHKPFYSEYIK